MKILKEEILNNLKKEFKDFDFSINENNKLFVNNRETKFVVQENELNKTIDEIENLHGQINVKQDILQALVGSVYMFIETDIKGRDGNIVFEEYICKEENINKEKFKKEELNKKRLLTEEELEKYYFEILKRNNRCYKNTSRAGFDCLIFKGKKALEVFEKYEKSLRCRYSLIPLNKKTFKKSTIELIFFGDNLRFEFSKEYNREKEIPEINITINDNTQEDIKEIIEIE